MVIQFAVVAIDHVQSRAAETVTAPLPPVAVNDDGVLDAVTWHLASAVGPVTEVCAEWQAAIPAARQDRNEAARNLLISWSLVLTTAVRKPLAIGKSFPTRYNRERARAVNHRDESDGSTVIR